MKNSIPHRITSMLLGFLMLILSCSSGQQPVPTRIFKISVFSSGTVLLDGKQIAMKDLEAVLNGAHNKGYTVWYYRESPASEPPPQVKEIMTLIRTNFLSVSFSTKPDFSDYVDSAGVSHPRTQAKDVPGLFTPRMPDVQPVPDIEKVFADARKMAASKDERRGVVIVLPDRKFGVSPAKPAPSESAVEGIERIVPSTTKRNIAVIGYTGFSKETFPSTSARDANRAIPFFGILLGLSYIGHSVWIFEGDATALAAGCRDADLLIVDSGMLPFLPHGWQDEAARFMRNPNIMVHDRATYQLRIVRKVGRSDHLEFHD